jgi:hypothetical protein
MWIGRPEPGSRQGALAAPCFHQDFIKPCASFGK